MSKIKVNSKRPLKEVQDEMNKANLDNTQLRAMVNQMAMALIMNGIDFENIIPMPMTTEENNNAVEGE